MTVENQLNKVLVAIDPTEKEHYALKRALMMNEFIEDGVKIHLFIALDPEKLHKIHDANDFSCNSNWFTELFKPMDVEKIEYTAEVIWTENWHLSMLDASKRHEADIVILSDYRRKEGQTVLSSSKWALLRDSKCPILIVDPSSKLQRNNVLAALNMQTDDPRYAQLNRNIAGVSSLIANSYGAEKHIVNAYESSEDFPDRAKLIRDGDARQENIHVKIGDPTEIIAEVADKINADVVVIGTLARKGVIAAMRGNKSEDIIRKLNRDVMVINSTTHRE